MFPSLQTAGKMTRDESAEETTQDRIPSALRVLADLAVQPMIGSSRNHQAKTTYLRRRVLRLAPLDLAAIDELP